MGDIYFGSDWHFSRFRKSTRSMKYDYVRSKDILHKYSKMIKDDDIFIYLGDLSYIGKKNTRKINECLEHIRQLPGKKIMIKGNHDESSDKNYRKLGFKLVTNTLRVDNVIFTHIPHDIYGNEINIHGHLHGADDYYNVAPFNHVDCFTGLFANYPIKLEPLLRNSEFIDQSLITEEFISNLKDEINKLVG